MEEGIFISRVLKFDSGGVMINQWIIGEQAAPAIHLPMGIVVDAGGHVYVADSSVNLQSASFRIQVMEYISEYCEYIANLYVSKSAPVSVEGGQTIVYSLYYINLGLGTASNVVLEDSLGPAVTFVSASSPGVYIPASNSVKWELGTLNMGDQGSQTLTVMTGSGEDEGTMITNRATISTSDPESSLDDNVATSETRITQFNLPPGVELEPNNGGGSQPSVYYETPTVLVYPSVLPSDPNCVVTGISYHVAIDDDVTGIDAVFDGVMHEDTTDPGHWKSDPITFYPSHGKANTTYTVYTSL